MKLRELIETIENRHYMGWAQAEHPMGFIRQAVVDAIMRGDRSAEPDDFEQPDVCSIVACIAATALRDAGSNGGEVVGNAFAVAIYRAAIVGEWLASGEYVESVRNRVFEQNGIRVA